MKHLGIEVTFTEDVLGMMPSNPDVVSEYIASNAPDAKTKKEEIEAIGVEEMENKAMTVFPRTEDGRPMFWDYQVLGFFKEACSMLRREKNEEEAKHSSKLTAFKKTIDGNIRVYPRRIPINASGELGNLQRPLRASTPQGDRVALASSEVVPAGSKMKFIVECQDDLQNVIIEWLMYGRKHGTGQWRNSGAGRFIFEATDLDTSEIIARSEEHDPSKDYDFLD